MFLKIPEDGLSDRPNKLPVRHATLDDVEAIAALEREISGISRSGDYRYFIGNEDALWHVFVVESAGGIAGFLVSCGSSALNMLGPGVARGEDEAAALIFAQLNCHRGRSPVLLVPVSSGKLVKQLYNWGARNCEMHVAQSYGRAQKPTGIIMPTFLPETG